MTKLIQKGLYTKTEQDLEEFADRVDGFNRACGFVAVEMEGRPAAPDEVYDAPHWKIELEFKSRGYAREFWLDPKYQKEVLV